MVVLVLHLIIAAIDMEIQQELLQEFGTVVQHCLSKDIISMLPEQMTVNQYLALANLKQMLQILKVGITIKT